MKLTPGDQWNMIGPLPECRQLPVHINMTSARCQMLENIKIGSKYFFIFNMFRKYKDEYLKWGFILNGDKPHSPISNPNTEIDSEPMYFQQISVLLFPILMAESTILLVNSCMLIHLNYIKDMWAINQRKYVGTFVNEHTNVVVIVLHIWKWLSFYLLSLLLFW